MMLKQLILVLMLSLTSLSFAADNVENAAVEARLKHLYTELRCLVCQNSTLADSDADLAKDLRREVRKLVDEGKTDEEVVDYLVARYGDFVTFRPPVNASTALLWFGPFFMLVIGLIILVVVLKRRSALIDAQKQ